VIGAAVTGGAAGALLITGLGLFLVDPPERLASTSPDAGPRLPADKEEPAPLDEVSILPAVGPDGGMVSLAWSSDAPSRLSGRATPARAP
jgi:hypothetical protein